MTVETNSYIVMFWPTQAKSALVLCPSFYYLEKSYPQEKWNEEIYFNVLAHAGPTGEISLLLIAALL